MQENSLDVNTKASTAAKETSEQFKHTPSIENVTRITGNYFNSLDEIKEVLVDYGTAKMIDGDLGICWTSLKYLDKKAPDKNTENDFAKANMAIGVREGQKSDIPAYVDAMIKIATETLDKNENFKFKVDYDGAKANFFKTYVNIDKAGQGYCLNIRNNLWGQERFTKFVKDKYGADYVYAQDWRQSPKEVVVTLPEDTKSSRECKLDFVKIFESLKQNFDIKGDWQDYKGHLRNGSYFQIKSDEDIQFIVGIHGLKDLKIDEKGIISGKMYGDKDDTKEHIESSGDWEYCTKNIERQINMGSYVPMEHRWELLPTLQIQLFHVDIDEKGNRQVDNKLIQDSKIKDELDIAAKKLTEIFDTADHLPVKEYVVPGYTDGWPKTIETLDLKNRTMTLSDN